MGGHAGSALTNSPADHFLNVRAKSNSAVPNRTVHIIHSTFMHNAGECCNVLLIEEIFRSLCLSDDTKIERKLITLKLCSVNPYYSRF